MALTRVNSRFGDADILVYRNLRPLSRGRGKFARETIVMAIKHILVALTGEGNAAHVPLCALKLAKRLSAHVTATDTVADPRTYISLDPTGFSAPPNSYGDIYRDLEKLLEHKRALARKSLMMRCPAPRWRRR